MQEDFWPAYISSINLVCASNNSLGLFPHKTVWIHNLVLPLTYTTSKTMSQHILGQRDTLRLFKEIHCGQLPKRTARKQAAPDDPFTKEQKR